MFRTQLIPIITKVKNLTISHSNGKLPKKQLIPIYNAPYMLQHGAHSRDVNILATSIMDKSLQNLIGFTQDGHTLYINNIPFDVYTDRHCKSYKYKGIIMKLNVIISSDICFKHKITIDNY